VAATIGATGTIEPLEVVDVGAQVAGRIRSFGTDRDGKTVDYGSVIEEGALLAKIDESVYAADLSVAKARELSAAANLEQMNARLDQAAGGEHPDGIADRVARRVVLLHEVSLGRGPRTVHDLVCLDLAAQVISDLPVDRLGHGSPRY